ncbi:putative Integral membrane protein [Seiridium cardinale]
MIAALAVNVSFCGMIAAEPFTGCGIHLHDLAARFGTAPVITYTKMTIANQILWALAVCLSKLSILLLCIRVFTTDIFIKLARATGLLVVLLGTATVLGALLQCRPFAYNWDQTIPDGHCGDQVLSSKITASLNVVLDVAVLILPMPYLLTLQLALTKKLVLVATFAGGLITCIFSALRIVAIVSMDYTDITYLAGLPSIYSILEPSFLIILACVPVLRPLLGGSYSSQGTYRGENVEQCNNTTQKRSLRARTMNKDGFLAIDDNKSDSHSSEYQLRPIGTTRESWSSGPPADEDGNEGHLARS